MFNFIYPKMRCLKKWFIKQATGRVANKSVFEIRGNVCVTHCQMHYLYRDWVVRDVTKSIKLLQTDLSHNK